MNDRGTCTVLLSSHRDYEKEKDWQGLRNDSPYSDALLFEPVEDQGTLGTQKFEMVVTTRWRSKVSGQNGSTPQVILKIPTDQNESG